MESNPFTITVNGSNYTIKQYAAMPPLYEVTCGTAYHQVGKTDAGLWVYVEEPGSDQHMPLQEIGQAIDEYFSQETE